MQPLEPDKNNNEIKLELDKELYEVLNHETRRNLIEILHENIEMTYSEVLKELEISDGLLNFHLRKMKNIIKTTETGSYIISDYGKIAYKIIKNIRIELKYSKKMKPQKIKPDLTKKMISKRILAFLLDGILFFFFTGVFLDPLIYDVIIEFLSHMGALGGLSPWVFHPEHLPMVGELIFRISETYAHVFFAIFILITALESYRGQTLGKYVLGIRVVTIQGHKIEMQQSIIRNAGKVFLLPLDLILGIFYWKKGFIRFFDFYTNSMIENVTEENI